MDKKLIPLPNFRYDDGNVSFMIGPGFYGSDIAEMLGVSEDYVQLCEESVKKLDGMVCKNEDCQRHKDVETKYDTENPEGIRVEESLAHVMSECNPSNALELAALLAVVFQDLLEDQRKNMSKMGRGSGPQALGELLGNLLGRKKEDSPESQIAKLLAETSVGSSDYNVGGIQFNWEAHEVWEAYGVSFARNIYIMGGVLQQFAIARDDPKMDGRTITKNVYDNVKVNDLQEQELRCMYIGKMMEKYENYRRDYEQLGADLDWRRYTNNSK